MARAWSCYDQLLADERVRYVEEPPDIEAVWRRYTSRRSYSTKVWNDAYLAAFASAAGFDVVTFDRGLAAHAGAAVTVLL